MAPVCHCGSHFGSAAALLQHQADRHRESASLESIPHVSRAAARAATRAARSRDIRLARRWKGLKTKAPIRIIDAEVIEPSVAPVSSTTPCELVCSYNWQKPKGFQAPGHAPLWQDLTLPITIPRDRKSTSARKPAWSISEYPFEPVFHATALMSPDFRFNDIDIVTTRNSLRKLLDFCSGRALNSFRVNLFKVRDTLFIEQYDAINMSSSYTGWGHSFEKTFTRYPPGLTASTSHDRFLRYPIGDLDCVVGFDVDACYEPKSEESGGCGEEPLEALQTALDKLAVEVPTNNETAEAAVEPPPQIAQAKMMRQSTAAEIKTKANQTSIGAFLPQLWFGRTPWLIMAAHTEGTFREIKITNAAAHFERWETDHQTELRKLATVLADLREAVRRNGGRGCAAVYEKDSGSRVIKIFPLAKGKANLPDEMFRKFWN